MKTACILFFYALATIAKLLRPGGAKRVIAENLAVRHQLIIANRFRKRAPNLTTWDRFMFGLWTMFIRTARIERIAIVVSPETLFKFHDALKKRKYRRLFSSKRKGRKPGPKGPSQELTLHRLKAKGSGATNVA
ncbi:MAG: hypothetical protein GY866_07325 [Proteobacteria bacterium]|nr:hypothetical protein [Pseudomonadota bacterium]